MSRRNTQAKLRLVHSTTPAAQPMAEREVLENAAVGRSGTTQLEDAELVALTLGGSRRAYELLYRRHVRSALLLATRLMGSTRDAEDAVHDAYVKAYEKLPELRDPSSFSSWLNSIVVRIVQTKMRRAQVWQTLGFDRQSGTVNLDALTSPEASPAARAQVAQVYALLQTMKVDDRIAWTLRYVQGHDLEAAAHLAGCSLAAVKRRIKRAQTFLNAHFVDTEQTSLEEKQ